MSKAGAIFAGLTSAVVTAAALGGAVAFAYFYPFDSNQQTEKITEETKSQEVISKSEEKEIPTKSSDTEGTSAPKSNPKIPTKRTKIPIDKTKVFYPQKTQDEQPPIKQRLQELISYCGPYYT